MSGNRRWNGGVIGGDENKISEGPGGAVAVVERRWQAKESDFGFKVFDLAFQLLLCLARLYVAFLAGACVARVVLFPTRDAAHRSVGIGFGSALAALGLDDASVGSPHLSLHDGDFALSSVFSLLFCLSELENHSIKRKPLVEFLNVFLILNNLNKMFYILKSFKKYIRGYWLGCNYKTFCFTI